MGTFTEAGINSETRQRVLRFLNSATTAESIAGREPQDGPVLDNPDRGYSGSRTGYDIGITVAHRIIDKRLTLGAPGFINLSQLSNIDGFGHDKFNDLIYSFSEASFGKWGEVDYITPGALVPVSVAQAALVHTPDDDDNGRVLLIERTLYGATSRTPLWKPEALTFIDAFEENAPNPPGLSPALAHHTFDDGEGNLYCSGHSFLSDGKLLAIGGGGQRGPNPALSKMAWIFDPQTKEWDFTKDLRAGANFHQRQLTLEERWYPTTITLGDDSGRVLIVGGQEDTSPFSVIEPMEMYNEETGLFTPVTGSEVAGIDQSFWRFSGDYPNLHLQRDGDIIFTRAYRWTTLPIPATFSFTGLNTGQWAELSGSPTSTSRAASMSVLLLGRGSEPDRILVVGGESNIVSILSIPATPSTEWRHFTFPDNPPNGTGGRTNAVLLPDETVFICGGSNPVSSYIFDPSRMASSPMTKVDDMNIPRDATHDQVLLLPSGKVASFGDDQKIDVFSPPYLYGSDANLATQPEITSWPHPYDEEVVLHGQHFEIEATQASEIERAVLVRPMAVSHQMDTEQRVVPLDVEHHGGSTLQITVPDGRVSPYGSSVHTHALAPAGMYMLFILNRDGVPSKAKFVQLR